MTLRDGRSTPSSGTTRLRADALAVLRAWSPPDERQAALRERYVAHLEARPDGTDRGCHPDHLTASTLVMSADGERVLLTLHAKAARWFQLGGHCEPGDTTLAGAARREAVEESGITDLQVGAEPLHLDEHAVPFCGSRGGVHHLDVRFLAVVPDDAEAVVSEESLDLRWWPVDALPDEELDDLVRRGRETLAGSGGQPFETLAPLAPQEPSTSSPGGGSRRAAADQPSR